MTNIIARDRMEIVQGAAGNFNMHMQLAFAQSGYGIGLLPARLIARNHSIDPVKVLRPHRLTCTDPSR